MQCINKVIQKEMIFVIFFLIGVPNNELRLYITMAYLTTTFVLRRYVIFLVFNIKLNKPFV